MMRRGMILVLVTMFVLQSVESAFAKPGKGRGQGGRGRGNSVAVSNDTRFSSTFPRGNAWGLRRNLGLSNTRVSPRQSGSLESGTIIRRAGRDWRWSDRRDAWVVVP